MTEKEKEYIISDEESDFDIDSMLEPYVSPTNELLKSSLGSQKEIKLIKDDKEYVGFLKKFILKETSDGKTVVSVVFNLKS